MCDTGGVNVINWLDAVGPGLNAGPNYHFFILFILLLFFIFYFILFYFFIIFFIIIIVNLFVCR